jgi:hypothetical protein
VIDRQADLRYYGEHCMGEGRYRDAALWAVEQLRAKDEALLAISSDERVPPWVQLIARAALSPAKVTP